MYRSWSLHGAYLLLLPMSFVSVCMLSSLWKMIVSLFFIFRQGYSSLAVALALPESGRLVACERDSNSLEVAQRYYELAGVSHKVILCFVTQSLELYLVNGFAIYVWPLGNPLYHVVNFPISMVDSL